MHFLDQAKIYVRSGSGGPGAVSFRREKFIEYGGPDGGNGGKGGDIVFECIAGLNTLIDFRYTQHFRAPRGSGGSGSNRTGAGGEDLVIRVPLGTQVLSEDKEEVLIDFTQVGQREVLFRGGDGGRGRSRSLNSAATWRRRREQEVVMRVVWRRREQLGGSIYNGVEKKGAVPIPIVVGMNANRSRAPAPAVAIPKAPNI